MSTRPKKRTPFRRLAFNRLHGYEQDELDNMGALLSLHLQLDRFIGILFSVEAYPDANRDQRIARWPKIARKPFAKRLDRLIKGGWFTAEEGVVLHELNEARNRLLHWEPGRDPREVGKIPQITDNDAFQSLYDAACAVLDELLARKDPSRSAEDA